MSSIGWEHYHQNISEVMIIIIECLLAGYDPFSWVPNLNIYKNIVYNHMRLLLFN